MSLEADIVYRVEKSILIIDVRIKGRSSKIKAKGIETNYEISGQGKGLALIHGFGMNLHMWYHQAPGTCLPY